MSGAQTVKDISHLPSEWPSSTTKIPNQRPCCNFCRGNHSTDKCWNLASIKQDLQAVKQALQIDTNKPWVNKANDSKRPFSRPNNGPLIKSNDSPCWSDNYNGLLVWNGPPSNPNTHYYGPSKRGKHSVCYRCGELGHYANECPNPRKQVGYTPWCGKCLQEGHLLEDCTTPPRKFPPSDRDYPKNKQVQFQEQDNP